MALADERLGGADGVPCFMNAGNDDPPEVDAVIDAAERVEFLEGRVVELPNGIELASCGYANLTPWHCPRDVPEDALGERLEAVVSQVEDPAGRCSTSTARRTTRRSTRARGSTRTSASARPRAGSRCTRWGAPRAAR